MHVRLLKEERESETCSIDSGNAPRPNVAHFVCFERIRLSLTHLVPDESPASIFESDGNTKNVSSSTTSRVDTLL